ncbi:PQQ-dependent sugar dehydrogenase [Streptomyces sp. CBMA152]|uniref:PQQ-dependent sugar dehydrogenase n=1 Tax=Streptomyces sp. CBMA152 TaxID=1896312 RepID=UPI002948C399|nr:PQQ-dependent sugar dehydrogenase [Streptomyces sp. CBMA152]MBD0744772.1 glucose sorbosone dehydrogenase [Streptomyces sp. CBMA152]
MRRPAVRALLAASALVLAAGCTSGTSPRLPGGTPSTATSGPSATSTAQLPPKKGSVKVVRTLADGLKSPWGVAPLPDGGLLVASRDDGTVTRIDAAGKKTLLGTVTGVKPGGEGGLLGLALSPSYASDHLVYAYFTTESDNRVARMLYDDKRPAGQQLGAPDTVLRGIPKGTIHNGGRIAFGPDKMLYVGTGETGERGLAQDKKSLGGKILRMTPDGQPVHGNPEADSVVYSYGHRNVQGLAWDDAGRLWASEFGQDTWDELNLIGPGENDGWPLVEGKGNKPGFVDPVEQWRTADASPSGIAYAAGSIWMAALRGERLWRIPLDGAKPLAEPEAFLTSQYGRLRTVIATGPHTLLLVTSATDGRGTPRPGDDRILELDVT